MKTLVLTACCKEKLTEKAMAKDLYQGQLFQKVRKYCEQEGFDYRILSAEHGLIAPECWVEPYDRQIKNRGDVERLQPLVLPELKRLWPDYDKVIVIMGDGDAVAIGGNHFIHAARRNIDLTAIILNNSIYGMTGGQYSPTTPYGMRSTTTVYSNIEQDFKISELAVTAGAVFVGRGTVYHTKLLDSLIEKAILKKGFSVVEVIAHCHTQYGRQNRLGSAVEMMEWQRDHALAVEKAATMKPEELQDKVLIGVLVDKELPVYQDQYEKIRERAKAEAER